MRPLPRESGPQEAVRIKLLGGFLVSIGDRIIREDGWRLRKAASLVKLLALSRGHRLHREQVMDALWPELGRRAASNNFRQTLHVARRTLQPEPAPFLNYLDYRDGQLLLCPDGPLGVDVEVFEDAVSAARRARQPAAYRAAIDLYAGELLPADRYEDWAETRRQELRRTFVSLLIELAELYEERREYDAAIEILGKAVAEQPLHEAAHVGLMRLHALAGSPAEALRQYERLETVLYGELGVRPEASSRRLRDEISAGRYPPRKQGEAGYPESTISRRHNLPAVRTSFVGREREMLEIKRELAMTRLLTLTGVGGSGKTRLALEVARDLTGAYPDGVWLTELAPLSDGSLVAVAVVETLGIQERAGQPPIETLVEALRTRKTLLVLDNCEHIVEQVAHLADVLLDACHGLRILATSREVLGVAGEVRWAVPALTTPGLRRSWTAEELESYESARLFAERARQREPAFRPTAGNALAVAEICTRLEGIPLSLELAAARVGTLGIAQISERLGSSLELLTTSSRTAAPRHRTLRGALDWSYELLSGVEKTLFERLSVFAGGWTLDAAEFVGSGNGIQESDVLDLLSGLVDKSLVVTESAGTDSVRYRFLEPVRQHAREKLEESRAEGSGRRRHAEFFLALAEEAEPGLRGPDQAGWRQRLDADLDNLRAALWWLTENGEVEKSLRLGSAMLFFWMWRGSLRECRMWLEDGLALGGAVTGPVRAKAMNALADITIMLGEYHRSQALLEESLTLYRAAGDAKGIAACLCDMGWLAVFQGKVRRGAELLEESIVLSRESGDILRTAFALNRLGSLAGSRREYDRAERLLEESLTLYREAGDMKSISMSLSVLGYLALRREDTKRAVSRIEESMELIREIGLEPDAFTLTALAVAVMMRGEHERARVLISEGLLRGRMTGNRLHTVQCIETAAMLATLRAAPEAAANLWGAAEQARDALGAPTDPDDQALFEPYLVAARTEIGGEAFEAAWEAGRKMSLDDAVEFVLSNTEASPRSGSPQDGEPSLHLTRREKEVAALVAHGLTNRRISSQLSVSERTVEHHVANILKKLGLNSREQVASRL